jgi:hypothetical protein
MGETCKHRADWQATSVVSRDEDFCSVGLVCLHCGECAFADLGPEAFRWSDENSPVDYADEDAEDPPPSDDAA